MSFGNFVFYSQGLVTPGSGWSIQERWFKPLSSNDLKLEVRNPALQCILTVEPVPAYNQGILIIDLEPFGFTSRGENA